MNQNTKEKIAKLIVNWRDGKGGLLENVINEIDSIVTRSVIVDDNPSTQVTFDNAQGYGSISVISGGQVSASGSFDISLNQAWDCVSYANIPDEFPDALYDMDFHNTVIVKQHPEQCFQGWVEIDTNNPVWQTREGLYIPVTIMSNEHLLKASHQISQMIGQSRSKYSSLSSFSQEEVVFLEGWRKVFDKELERRDL